MAVGEFAGDGEAEAGAPAVAGAGIVEPDDAFEDPLGVLSGYARPVVVHGQDDLLVPVPDVDLDAARGVASGVVDEVAQQSPVLPRTYAGAVVSAVSVTGRSGSSYCSTSRETRAARSTVPLPVVGAWASRRARSSRSSARLRRRPVCRAAVATALGQSLRSG
ncbi:hypothetical protein JOC24_002721 [Streptomyces sp. HB132]|nr:hypothetical protein [Streptomyces sp. HB132]